MILYFNSTTLDVTVSDDSYRYQQIMGEHSLTLTFALPTYVEIPVGAYCDFQGETYTLRKPQNLKKQHSRNFEYTLIMEASQSLLTKYKFKDTNTGKLKFWLTAKPLEHLQMLVANLNLRDSGWSVGDFVDASEKLISFNHNNCAECLRMMAEAFNTEYEVVGKIIHLRRVEYNKTTPLPLSYGKGNGLKPGVGRTNFDSSTAVEILYVQGGEKNINPSTYGATELLLPKSQALTYEGRAYVTDAAGLYIKRSDKALQTNEEDSLDCSHIYPSRTGTISSVVVVDAVNNFYDFIDTALSFDYNSYLIAGETMTVIFQSGMLAGREFEVKYIHAAILNSLGQVVKEAKRFEIVPQEIDGQTMPNATFKPAPGDTYVVFGITMPSEYVCDDVNKTGASWDMYREAVKYLYENEDPRFSFTGEMDGIYTKTNWANIGAKIKLGGFVLFSDAQFQITGVPIRIIGMKQPCNNPYKPQIELSNVTAGNTVSSVLRKVETSETFVSESSKQQAIFTKRRYRDAKETMELLKNAQLHFTEAINPITVETMSLLVGDISLQFRFVAAYLSQTVINHNIVWDNEAKKLKVDAGWLQHMTLGIGSITKSHAAEEYKYWNLPYFESPFLEDQLVNGEMKSLSYYLYAHCTGDGVTTYTASFVLSSTALQTSGADYYFLVGVLNSEFENDRSFASLYGYTEVLPGRITSDRIVSTDGLNFLDFVKNSFRVGSSDKSIEWNRPAWDGLQYVGDGVLRLKGSLVQSQSGDEELLGIFRGDYSSTNIYYQGDTVVYNGSTYKYINLSATSFIPTNTTYWKLYASQGITGNFTEIRYQKNTSATTAPSLTVTDVAPAGWTTAMPSISTGEYIWYTSALKTADGSALVSNWVAATRITGVNGLDGTPIVPKGSFATAPANPQTGWTYYNTTDKKSYIYGISSWSVMTEQGVAGVSSYLHIKYSNDGGTTFTGNAGEDVGTYIGICVDSNVADPTTVGAYTWALIKGADGTNGTNGTDGLSVFYTYNDSYNIPATPTGDGTAPAGWHTAITATSKWQSSKIAASISAGTWGTPIPCKSPVLNFRGDFVQGATYTGNANSVDVVYYPTTTTYYMIRADQGSIVCDATKLPDNTAYWDTFGASFSSVATGLLFASMAVVDNLTTKYLNTGGTGQRVEIDGATGTMTFYNASNVAVMTLANGYLTAVGSHLQNALFTSADPINTAYLGIESQALVIKDDYGFSIQLNPWGAIFHKSSMSFYDAFQDFYNTTLGMDYLCSLNIKDSGGIARTSLTSAYVKANMIQLRQLTTEEIATVPAFGIYVDTNGQHCAKDGNGTPHTLW